MTNESPVDEVFTRVDRYAGEELECRGRQEVVGSSSAYRRVGIETWEDGVPIGHGYGHTRPVQT